MLLREKHVWPQKSIKDTLKHKIKINNIRFYKKAKHCQKTAPTNYNWDRYYRSEKKQKRVGKGIDFPLQYKLIIFDLVISQFRILDVSLNRLFQDM